MKVASETQQRRRQTSSAAGPVSHVLFRLISIARYAFKSLIIHFWGTKDEIFCEHVAYFHSILWRQTRLQVQHSASYHGFHIKILVIFILVQFFLEDNPLYFEKAVCLLRDFVMFLPSLGLTLCLLSLMFTCMLNYTSFARSGSKWFKGSCLCEMLLIVLCAVYSILSSCLALFTFLIST